MRQETIIAELQGKDVGRRADYGVGAASVRCRHDGDSRLAAMRGEKQRHLLGRDERNVARHGQHAHSAIAREAARRSGYRGGVPRSCVIVDDARAETAGKRRDDDLLVIADRREAIDEAFRRARPGDVVLLAGKGHETWNMGPNGPEPWSDRETAESLLSAP